MKTLSADIVSLDKFRQHQLVKFDFTADLTNTGNRSKSHTVILFVYDSIKSNFDLIKKSYRDTVCL